jgi:hypothetical protein
LLTNPAQQDVPIDIPRHGSINGHGVIETAKF